jgi:hypothetical protein
MSIASSPKLRHLAMGVDDPAEPNYPAALAFAAAARPAIGTLLAVRFSRYGG